MKLVSLMVFYHNGKQRTNKTIRNVTQWHKSICIKRIHWMKGAKKNKRRNNGWPNVNGNAREWKINQFSVNCPRRTKNKTRDQNPSYYSFDSILCVYLCVRARFTKLKFAWASHNTCFKLKVHCFVIFFLFVCLATFSLSPLFFVQHF